MIQSLTTLIYGLIRDGDYTAAAQILEEKVELFPRSRAALSLLAYCYYNLQEYTDVIEIYNRLIQLVPNEEDYHVNRIHCMLRIGAVVDANESLSHLIEESPSQRLLLLKIACELEDDNLEGAREYLDECDKSDPQSIAAEATIEFKEGDYKSALDKYLKVSRILGQDTNTAYNVSLSHYMLGRYDDAEELVDEIIHDSVQNYPQFEHTDNPHDDSFVSNSIELQESFLIEAYNLKTAIYYRLKNETEARQAFALMPHRRDEELDAVSLHNSAILNQNGDPEVTLKKLGFLLSHPPFPPGTFQNLLILYCQHECFDAYMDVIADNGELVQELLDKSIHDFLDTFIMSKSSPEGAFSKFQALLKRLSPNMRSLVNAIEEIAEMGETQDLEFYEIELERELDTFIPVLMAMTKILWDREEFSKAESLLLRYSDICATLNMFNLNLGHCCFAQESKKLQKSIEYYKTYIESESPDGTLLDISPIVLANLTVAYILSDQNEDAENIIKRIDDEESSSKVKDKKDDTHHSCIINLVLASLYCEKGNYEFGIERLCKSLHPFQTKLGADTWYYAKRLLLSLLKKVAFFQEYLTKSLTQNIYDLLDEIADYCRSKNRNDKCLEESLMLRRALSDIQEMN
ncbi:hypothetical protein CTEN210_16869 [Chaetoceros tenuissimus]|uniref:Tetratricopeptide repeat protein 30 n=1 Tax=Chaetoceros tenuissimus TaxID=426638 RepID=A0AAD3HEU5_9STRA|nr:hypothetical protein CTEN210_16869 [Chaetoceros tenuissimus]